MNIFKEKGFCNNCSSYTDVYRIMPDSNINIIVLCKKCVKILKDKVNTKE